MAVANSSEMRRADYADRVFRLFVRLYDGSSCFDLYQTEKYYVGGFKTTENYFSRYAQLNIRAL